MNRRGFLAALATGVVGACVASHLPTAWLPQPVRRRAALDFLTVEFNRYMRGRGSIAFPTIVVGPALYGAIDSELESNQRYTSSDSPRAIAFKACKLYRSSYVAPWSAYFLSGTEWAAQRSHLLPHA